MLKSLDGMGGKPNLLNGGSVDGCYVPVKKPLLGRHYRLLLLEMLQEDSQDLHDVGAIEGDAPGNNVRVD